MARLEDAIRQKHPNVRRARAGDPTGILQAEPSGETLDDDQQMRVDDGRWVEVGNLVDVPLNV